VVLQAADTELLGFGDNEGDDADSDMDELEDDSEDEQTPTAPPAAAAAKKGEYCQQLSGFKRGLFDPERQCSTALANIDSAIAVMDKQNPY